MVAAVAAAGASALLAACSATVPGTAVVAVHADPATAPLPLDQVLPTAAELATTLGGWAIGGQGFMGQLVEGGPDVLLAGVGQSEATPVDCVGASYRLQRVVYGASPVRAVASRSWAGGGSAGPTSSAFFGVVKLASAGDARAFFAATADKWRGCDGTTVVLDQADRELRSSTRITEVTAGDRIVSAVLVRDADGVIVQRALGVGSDCIVDVEVSGADGDGAVDAVDIAALMLRKATGS
ncbi:MAG: sensor domain-containing protein [Actinobacteria bacterium]|nr:sensor domain-containing protein [Actinomycetota bacterium]